MKVLLINNNAERSVEFRLGNGIKLLAVTVLCIAPLLFGYVGYSLASLLLPSSDHPQVVELKTALEDHKKKLKDLTLQAQLNNDALSVRVAQLQARLIRLDALGERVVEVAKFDKQEFDFETVPAVGGVYDNRAASVADGDSLEPVLLELEQTIDQREQQLDVMSLLLKDRQLAEQTRVQGWPIESGWMSSGYGKRTDPFTGKLAMHKGVDFASAYGDPVRAIAAGVVTWSGKRYGYGLTVEVNHGGGYVTRYAHNSENIVSVGQLVKKDEEIAKIGSSGRSTGPHLHLEVFKNGRNVDPASYIRRTNRS